ncbi:MAG: hypothetical protein AB7P99_15450 [Vicinamibacterales bacterium]
MRPVQRFVCGLRGHDVVLHFEQGRMSLQCTSCHYETPGWDLKGAMALRASASRCEPRIGRLPMVQ